MSSTHRTPLTAGPYVIRNKKTSTALHIRYATSDNNSILASRQDESLYRDQQIWWIEPLAHYTSEEDPEGLVYSITNPGTGKSLEADPKSGYVNTNEHHGAPWQRWRLREALSDDDGEIYYNIVNIFNDKVIDIQGSSPKPGAWVQESAHKPDRDLQCWEFVVPAVFFPAGWFYIENVRTGNLLRHNYVSSTPEFLPAPNALLESQYKEQWEFQWTLSNPKVHKLYDDIERKSWMIINRLTRTPLHPSWINMTAEDLQNYEKLVLWTLEMDGFSKWKIMNRSTNCLLQQAETPHGPGTALVCSERRYHRNGSQGWFLRLPLLHTEEKEPHKDIVVADTEDTTHHDDTTIHTPVNVDTPWAEEHSPPDYASSLT